MTIDKLYLEHIGVLQKTGLTPKKFQTLEDLRLKEEERKTDKEEEKNKRTDFQTIYFILAH
eukprot:239056-Ditylum_brightwellii.AAC.1